MKKFTLEVGNYLAEQIKLQAEKAGLTEEQLVINFFARRCNAPRKKHAFFLHLSAKRKHGASRKA